MKRLIYEFLCNEYYLIMKAILMFLAVSFFLSFNQISLLFKKVNKKTWFILAFILLIGFGMRMWFVPHTHHVYFDEFEHINIAENMSYGGKFAVCAKGTDKLCESYQFPNWPCGYHTILALVFSVFGNSEAAAYNLSAVIGTISILILFLMAYLLFNSQGIALGCAFLFSLIPAQLKYSGASSMDITSLFFVLLSFVSLLAYLRISDIKSLLLFIAVLAFTVYVRPENGIFPLFMLCFSIIFVNKGSFKDAKKIYMHSLLFSTLLFLLLLPYFMHIYFGIYLMPPPGWSEGWGERLFNLREHLFGNIKFWFGNFHPLSFTVLAVFGFLRLMKDGKKKALFFLAWFSVFLLFYSFYHIGDFSGGADGDRYTLVLYVSIVLYAGFGLFHVFKLVKFNQAVMFIIPALIFFEIFSPLKLGLQRTLNRDIYKEYRFILGNKDLIADDTYVITYNAAAIISSIHKKAVTPYVFNLMAEPPEEAVLFKDFWWYERIFDSRLLESRLKEKYKFTPLSEENTQDDKRFYFFKLKLKESPKTP